MISIDELEFTRLCAEMCADREHTWRSHADMTKEDALWWDLYRRLCYYLGEQPQLVDGNWPVPYAEACRFNIMRITMARRIGYFNAVQIAYNHVREALGSTALEVV